MSLFDFISIDQTLKRIEWIFFKLLYHSCRTSSFDFEIGNCKCLETVQYKNGSYKNSEGNILPN